MIESIFPILREAIAKFEGRPQKIIYEQKYLKWVDSIEDNKLQTKIHTKIENIELFGIFGKKSHECRSRNKIYEIVIDGTTLRIYFSEVDNGHIRFEDGSSTKSSSGNNDEQARKIRAIDKTISRRNSYDK